MINSFIKLTGTDGYGSKRTLFLNVNQICGYFIDTRGHNTKIISGAEIFCAIETPEEISAMIQKYYDEKMRLGFIHSALTGMCSDSDAFPTWESVSRSAINIGDMVMEDINNV